MIKRGQALIEVMVGMAIAAVLLPALTTAFFAARGGKAQETVRLMAVARVREAREGLRVIKEDSWDSVAVNGSYDITIEGGEWSLAVAPGPMLDEGLQRTIQISDAYRDENNQLTTTAGGNVLDPSVKQIVIRVEWQNPIPGVVVDEYYLMRLTNLSWVQTTEADFTAGVSTGVAITNTSGGEVVLGSGGEGHADWCDPSLTLVAVDLPKNGVANAISAKSGGGSSPNPVIAGTGDNASGVSLAKVEVTNATPPNASVLGTYDGFKTNGVFVTDRYAYIGTDTNSKEVEIVDLNNQDPGTGKYAEAGFFNAPGAGNGSSVATMGNWGLVTVGDKLYSYDLTGLPNAGSSRAQLGVVSLAGTGAKIAVSGSYVFVAESSGSRPMEVIQVGSEGTSLSVVGWASVVGETGVDVAINSTATRAYLATAQGKVHILNTTNLTGELPAEVGVFNTNGMSPKGVAVLTHNRAAVVGTGGSLQYQIIDITNEGEPKLCTNGGTTAGGLSIPSGVNGVAGIQEEDGDAYAYIITGDASSELKVIQGGGGGGGGVYANEGVFESSIFDAGHASMFNRMEVTAVAPQPDTTMTYQVAITNPAAGSCEGVSYAYVGPDKTSGSFFSGSSQLPLGTGVGYSNPGQCLRYKAYLTTANTNNTPVLYDVTINYSP